MEEICDEILREQSERLQHFVEMLSSQNAENVLQCLQSFLQNDTKLQKFVHKLQEHQQLSKQIVIIHRFLLFCACFRLSFRDFSFRKFAT